MQQMLIVGYSGHAYTVLSAVLSQGNKVKYYLDLEEKKLNPYDLTYGGAENGDKAKELLKTSSYFVCIGNNSLRAEVDGTLSGRLADAVVHISAVVAPSAWLASGVFIGPGAIVNPLARVSRGAIVNSRATVEHECRVGEYAHIAPGATLLGNVVVGPRTLIGGNAVVLPGINIGADCTVGAGSVVLHDLPDGSVVAGNPARPL